ncbi:flagellar motor switch protein FliN [Pacificimonas flava]|uniref:Flagellar motor switch protein FliN n=2 Tax=Pacificimonas TaxID=1960290 RepID=A0A219BA76_9SPHN|nr:MULTISPECIES: flagellar motor switch protein FliN [Pacificimonas]MBZ6379212.1 flagellar motor switch protein FliN [Pacificimonas aurantium]OWV34709.1 flagellar motor switch protein FliN [Pacificimonas flava]
MTQIPADVAVTPAFEDLGAAEPASDPATAAADARAEHAAPAEAKGVGGLRSSLLAVHDVPVKVKVVLGRSRMRIERLLELEAGAVVELDRRVGEPVDVYVNDRLIARGEVVMIDSSLGVTLTEVVRQDS